MSPSVLTGPKAQPVLGTGTFYGVCAQRGKTIRRSKQYTKLLDNKVTRVGRCHCGLHVFMDEQRA